MPHSQEKSLLRVQHKLWTPLLLLNQSSGMRSKRDKIALTQIDVPDETPNDGPKQGASESLALDGRFTSYPTSQKCFRENSLRKIRPAEKRFSKNKLWMLFLPNMWFLLSGSATKQGISRTATTLFGKAPSSFKSISYSSSWRALQTAFPWNIALLCWLQNRSDTAERDAALEAIRLLLVRLQKITSSDSLERYWETSTNSHQPSIYQSFFVSRFLSHRLPRSAPNVW